MDFIPPSWGQSLFTAFKPGGPHGWVLISLLFFAAISWVSFRFYKLYLEHELAEKLSEHKVRIERERTKQIELMMPKPLQVATGRALSLNNNTEEKYR